jgi:hypothetical protein
LHEHSVTTVGSGGVTHIPNNTHESSFVMATTCVKDLHAAWPPGLYLPRLDSVS